MVRSVCGREVERVVRLTGGGMNETYRVELPRDVAVVVRIARQPVPWFTDEEHVMAQARGVGVPTPEVLGVEQVDHDGELLSFSIQRFVPGRPLHELASELPASDLERLVMDGGELLARVHRVIPNRGIRAADGYIVDGEGCPRSPPTIPPWATSPPNCLRRSSTRRPTPRAMVWT